MSIGRISNGTLRLRDDVALLGRAGKAGTHNLERILVFRRHCKVKCESGYR